MYFGSIAFFATGGWRSSVGALALYGALAGSGILSVFHIHQGRLLFPVNLGMTWLFLLSAILFLRAYPRLSSGVVTTVFGFIGWSVVWGIATFLPGVVSMMGQYNEFWNVPKYILAFGMILILLEDEQYAAEAARNRESNLNQQLESFAEVTSRLLSGENVPALCGEIARVITSVTTFSRVVILLSDEQQKMHVAGACGVAEKDMAKITDTVARITPQNLGTLEENARSAGRASFICSFRQLEPFGAIPGTSQFPDNPYWKTGDELLVPIRSPRGAYVGFFILDEPRDVLRVNASEMSKLELLANDLGVAIERRYLQRELIRQEKLVGVGQLVAGMAHELNNPLTAVLGYAEILGDTASDPQVRQQASVIQRESLRMKRIIENLVRFAKQEPTEPKVLSLKTTLHETLKLWGYQARSRGIELEINVEKDLPMVHFDEAQMKQVLLNLLSNAFDAVDGENEKKISVDAAVSQGSVHLIVRDSGPGFVDPERVFDPFFSTKGIGKGSGLGLSVCYGIVKQHGGDIRAHNLEPHGACITIELPAAQQQLALASGS
jgi:two-component system NtrC family sensor kinase